MARCEDCIHGEICERFAGLRTLVCGYKAEERCKMFKPTADVAEVVRCKDCKYRYVPTRCALWTGTIGEKDYFRYHGDDFYCSFGERKE